MSISLTFSPLTVCDRNSEQIFQFRNVHLTAFSVSKLTILDFFWKKVFLKTLHQHVQKKSLFVTLYDIFYFWDKNWKQLRTSIIQTNSQIYATTKKIFYLSSWIQSGIESQYFENKRPIEKKLVNFWKSMFVFVLRRCF